MTVTPWGRSEELRSRKLSPGPQGEPRLARRNQRERLLGAMVAVIAEKGYEATRVADVLDIAGISRNTFYRHFDSKHDCFMRTLEVIAEEGARTVDAAYRDAGGPWREQLDVALSSVFALAVQHPAAARLALVDVYAAGPEAIARVEAGLERAVRGVAGALEDSPAHAGMPTTIVRSVLGGLQRIVYGRLREGRQDELPGLVPQLLDWATGYRTPATLRHPAEPPAGLRDTRPPATHRRRRMLDAVSDLVAEKGYPAMTITDIAARASVSLTTVYDTFGNKEGAFLATLDDAQQRTLALTIPAVVAAEDWEHGISAAAHVFFGFMTSEPATAQLGGVGVWATSPAVLDLRAQGMASFQALLDHGYRLYPDTNPLAREAIGLSVDALLFDGLRHLGADRVYELAPTGAFLVLAPFVGSERACELANEEPKLVFG